MMKRDLVMILFLGIFSFQVFAVEYRYECSQRELQEIRDGLESIQIILGSQYIEEVNRTLNSANFECFSIMVPGDVVPRGGRISRFELWSGAKAHFLKIVHYRDSYSSYIALERMN